MAFKGVAAKRAWELQAQTEIAKLEMELENARRRMFKTRKEVAYLLSFFFFLFFFFFFLFSFFVLFFVLFLSSTAIQKIIFNLRTSINLSLQKRVLFCHFSFIFAK